jgi:hypothetical protein
MFQLRIVIYNSRLLIMPLLHLGDDHTRGRIYIYCFRLHLSGYICLYKFTYDFL